MPGAVAVSVLATLVIFVLLAAAAVWTLDTIAESEAEREAASLGEVTARVAMAPFLTDALLDGTPEAIAAIDAAGRGLLANSTANHLKIWSADGTIVWSEESELVGRRFELEDDEAQLLAAGEGVSVGVSELDRDENAVETRNDRRLIEVYFATRTASGRPILVETYYPYGLASDRSVELRNEFLPLLIGGLAMLALAQVPITIALARRLSRYQREREHLLERVIDASDAERRRIAAEVHDGAVQDLIGVTFALSAVADTADPDTAGRTRALADDTRRIVRSLRSLLSSIYPVKVPSTGWTDGLDDLVAALRERGVEVTIDVPDIELSPADEHLLLRVTREALRNVNSHSKARHVVVRMSRRAGRLVLDVHDDGAGFDPVAVSDRHQVGHLGLQLLRDLANDVGARLSIESTPGDGTDVHLEVLERV